MKKFKILAAFIWGLIVIVLSVLPGNKVPTVNWLDVLHVDKIAHFIFYFLWMILLFPKEKKFRLAALIVVVLIGICLEFIQGNFIQNRTFSFHDIFFNLFGAMAGFFFALKFGDKIWNHDVKRKSP